MEDRGAQTPNPQARDQWAELKLIRAGHTITNTGNQTKKGSKQAEESQGKSSHIKIGTNEHKVQTPENKFKVRTNSKKSPNRVFKLSIQVFQKSFEGADPYSHSCY